MKLKEKIIDLLKQCYDPEIPIDLWSLGLIYNIDITPLENEMSDVNITMSLTTPGCSMGQHMAEDIKTKVSSIMLVNIPFIIAKLIIDRVAQGISVS